MLQSRNSAAGLIRSINRSAILTFIRESGPLSRTQIARELQLSLPTIMRVVDELKEEQLVKETGAASTGGRPSPLIEFNGEAFAIIGIDLGGTKIYGMVADLAGNIQHSLYRTHAEVVDVNNRDSISSLMQFITELLDAPRPAGQKIKGIGIGAPGITLVPGGIVTWAPSLGWRDLPLQEMLSEQFDLPVTVENDVNLAALGEWGFGAGKNTHSLVTIAVGTGIGAGIIIDGAIYRGFKQAAGEVGYLVPDLTCLGKHYTGFGALESLASGTGIANRAKQILCERNLPLPTEDLNARSVFAQAQQGVGWAKQVVSETNDYLALAIANISVVLDPELIVLGGGVAQSADLLIPPIQQRLEGVIPVVPRIVTSTLGRQAAVMGAIMQVMKATDEYLVVKQLT